MGDEVLGAIASIGGRRWCYTWWFGGGEGDGKLEDLFVRTFSPRPMRYLSGCRWYLRLSVIDVQVTRAVLMTSAFGLEKVVFFMAYKWR